MEWTHIKNKKPLAYQKGDWEGLRSDKVLVCTSKEKFEVGQMYEGTLDGCEFCEFYDNEGFEIYNVTFWAKINSPY